MNLTVTSTGFEYQTCHIIVALKILAHIHHDFQEPVSIVIEEEAYPYSIKITIPSIGVDWFPSIEAVYADKFETHIPIEQACAKIKELTSPRVDQPAPARTAAEIQWREVNEHHWVGREYSVEYRGSGGWAAYCGSDRLGDHYLFPTLEAAKKACQDHKQGRLEELL